MYLIIANACPNGESHLDPSQNPCTEDDDCPYGYICNHPNPNLKNGVCCCKYYNLSSKFWFVYASVY